MPAAVCQYTVGEVISGIVTHKAAGKIQLELADGTKAMATGDLAAGQFMNLLC